MVDKLDKKIIEVLQKDSRKSFREIAKMVESTTVTVINRVNKLQEKNIIKGYSVDLNYENLDYSITGIISIIASDRNGLKKLEQELEKYPNICGVYEVTGEIDVVVIGKFKELKDLQNFVKEDILAKGYAKKTVSQIVTDVYKEDHRINLD